MRLTVGILTHNSEQVIGRCLETVMSQTGLGELNRDWQVISLDNASNNRIELIRLEKRFPQVRFLREETNRGFAYGHNIIMRSFPAELHAVLNCDLLLAPNFLAILLKAIADNSRYGSAVGKLLRWDARRGALQGAPTTERISTIDSVGIGVTKSHAFFDIGQGTPLRSSSRASQSFAGQAEDRGQYEKQEERFGGSGAAVLYRRSALEEVAYHCHTEQGPSSDERSCEDRVEVFDETMFLYKEDIDLAYRLLTVDHPCLYVPEAVGWHARSVGKALLTRRRRPEQTRIWSTAHESLLLRKHASWWPLKVRLRTILRQLLKWCYLFAFEPRVFFSARKLLKKLEPEAKKRRAATTQTVSFERIAHLFR